MDYISFFDRLAESNVDYIVVGGLAVNFHGIPRMTYDIDIMIRLEPDNIQALLTILDESGYRPRIAEDLRDLSHYEKRLTWLEDKGSRAFTFWNDRAVIAEIDVVIDSPVPYEELRARAMEVRLEDIVVPTISVPDLIRMKLRTGRRQDLSDVEHLRRLLDE